MVKIQGFFTSMNTNAETFVFRTLGVNLRFLSSKIHE